MIDRAKEAYREEAAELLAELEVSLLELEESPEDGEIVARVFRAMHTIKGSGAMFGFDEVAAFTHDLETVFDLVREGRIRVSPELIGVTLAARDHIRALLASPAGGAGELEQTGREILTRLREAAGAALDAPEPERSAAAPGVKPAPVSGSETTYRIRFVPPEDIFLNGTNPLLLLGELRQLGVMSVLADVSRIPELDAIDPERCWTGWDVLLTTSAGEDAIRDVFIFVEDLAQVSVQAIERLDWSDEHARLGDILVDRGSVSPEVLAQIVSEQRKLGELLVEAGAAHQREVDAALLEQAHLKSLLERRDRPEVSTTLRVPAVKLDNLVNMVGELVTVQARLSGCASASGDPEIGFIAEEVERLTELLRDSTMSLRMVPIGDAFSRLRRLVRDLAGELGKKIELVTEGAETELDKTVIEQLNDPLVHLIRNAIDHGIEDSAARAAAGKPEVGRLNLSAAHSGAFVHLTISDDGAGLDRDAIRARAVERGLIRPDAELSEHETDSLILSPGFSTAARVTEVSGRGVGMDVVKRSLDALRGTLSIDSLPGRGTTITLKIPLTLAIIDGLLVIAGDTYYVLPLSNILECIELRRTGSQASGGKSIVVVRGELVPYVVLRERFGIPGHPPEIEHVIVVDTREGKCGLVVDRVVGDHHTVIKKLGGLYRHVEEISGATILGDGTVALIVDADKLVKDVVRETTAT